MARKRNKKYDHDLIIELTNKGYNTLQVCFELGCSETLVNSVLRKNSMGKGEKRYIGKDKEKIETIIRFRNQGDTFAEIAKKLDVSAVTCFNLYHKYNQSKNIANEIKKKQIIKEERKKAVKNGTVNYVPFDEVKKNYKKLIGIEWKSFGDRK